MGQFIDITGKRYGRLVVIGRSENDKRKKIHWMCQCDCGRVTNVVAYSLNAGLTKSCGCIASENMLSIQPKGWEASTIHDSYRTRLFKTWINMIDRCYNPNNKGYHRYGGRGITICDEWRHDFAAFRDWALMNGYKDDLTIDRIDNNGIYSPLNCQWLTGAANSAKQHVDKLVS